MINQYYLGNIRQQYEKFPYPPRNPDDEKKRLLEVSIDKLDTINFYCFKGRKTFENARILIAGGGTGDSTIYLAEQLRHKNAEIVYLDVSQSSMEIAKQRAAIRGLTNIRWVHDSIMSISVNDVGEFDYISCTGVLHHLESPMKGLECLNAVLKPSGAMGLMVYGKYGRTGVYQLQTLMRAINQGDLNISDKIENTKKVLDELPKSNWFRHNEHFLTDHKKLGDSGLVDLLLHEQDTAYTIPEIYEMLDKVDLQLIEFSDVKMRLSYRPEQYINDTVLLEKIQRLSTKAQQGIAELLVGAFKKHEFYVSRSAIEHTKAKFKNLSNIPFFYPERQYGKLGQQLAIEMEKNPNNIIALRHLTGFEFDLMPNELTRYILSYIDGNRDLKTIFSLVREKLSANLPTDEQLITHFYPIYAKFQQLDWLLVKGPAIECYSDTIDLQHRYEQNR